MRHGWELSMRHAPPSFHVDGLGRIVFAKFHLAHHAIEFEVDASASAVEATVRSTIEFTTRETGCPVIDLEVSNAEFGLLTVDGDEAPYPEFESPPTRRPETRYRVCARPLEAGAHRAILDYRLTGAVVFDTTLLRGIRFEEGLECFMELSDRPPHAATPYARPFLERYLPSNLEFDHHPIHIDVKIRGIDEVAHRIVANGLVTQRSSTEWRVDYPHYFTCSSPFFLLAPEHRVASGMGIHRTPSGTRIHAHILGLDLGTSETRKELLRDCSAQTLGRLHLLEQALGRFPHRQLIVRFWPFAGMEYAGAACVSQNPSFGDLTHELIHSWVGRCVMPADGDAGWFDEGVTKMIERELPAEVPPENEPSKSSNFGDVSPYRRYTHETSWDNRQVFHFMEYMRGLMPGRREPWTAFVRHLVARNRFASLQTREIQAELEAYAGRSFAAEFDEYVLRS